MLLHCEVLITSVRDYCCDIFVISSSSDLPILDILALILIFFPVCADLNGLILFLISQAEFLSKIRINFNV